MKKKILLILLAIVSALCLMFGITACGGGKANEGDTWTMDRLYAKAQELGFTGTWDELVAEFKGEAGKDGKNGKDGKDGIGIKDIYINENGELIVELTEGEPVNLGSVKGKDGTDGAPGKDGEDGKDGKDGVTPHIGENGHWWIGDTDTGVSASGTGSGSGSGQNGKSAYELWLDQGYEGTIDDFFLWVRGAHYHRDVDKNGYCDECEEHIHHRDDNNDTYCDECEKHYEHRDSNKNCECDVCGESLPHIDVDDDGFCDTCHTNLMIPEIVYTLVGTGSGEGLWTSKWDQTADIESLIMEGHRKKDGSEVHTITLDLYEGDEFQIIHDHDWVGQIGFNSLANEGKDEAGNTLFVSAGGFDILNIAVAEGASGTYDLTLTIAEGKDPEITFKRIEIYEDLVHVKLVGQKNEPIGPSYASFIVTGRVYKTGSTVPAIPFIPDDTLAPPMMVFDGWSKEDGSRWEGGTVDADITLKAHYAEKDEPTFYIDTNEYYLIGNSSNRKSSVYEVNLEKREELKFVRDESYSVHNCFILENMKLSEGDIIQIAWGENLARYDQIKIGRGDFDIENDFLNEYFYCTGHGNYRFCVFSFVDADGNVTDLEIYIDLMGAFEDNPDWGGDGPDLPEDPYGGIDSEAAGHPMYITGEFNEWIPLALWMDQQWPYEGYHFYIRDVYLEAGKGFFFYDSFLNDGNTYYKYNSLMDTDDKKVADYFMTTTDMGGAESITVKTSGYYSFDMWIGTYWGEGDEYTPLPDHINFTTDVAPGEGGDVSGGESGGNDEWTQQITLHYHNINNWPTVSVYSWESEYGTEFLSRWPGTAATEIESNDWVKIIYNVHPDALVYENVYVIFNNSILGTENGEQMTININLTAENLGPDYEAWISGSDNCVYSSPSAAEAADSQNLVGALIGSNWDGGDGWIEKPMQRDTSYTEGQKFTITVDLAANEAFCFHLTDGSYIKFDAFSTGAELFMAVDDGYNGTNPAAREAGNYTFELIYNNGNVTVNATKNY